MKNGFTIIELIISIFILSVAVVGIFGAFSIIVILTSDAADRLQATYLAQEGMEIVRNIRDTNWLKMDAALSTGTYTWVDGLTTAGIGQSIDCAQGCEADYTTTGSGAHPMYNWVGSGNYLNINTNGFYVYDPSNLSPTKFKRKIIITCLPDNDCAADHIIKVAVQVSWNQKATILNSGSSDAECLGSNCVTAEGTLYDWYNYLNQ